MSRAVVSVALLAGCSFGPAPSSVDGNHLPGDGSGSGSADAKLIDAIPCYGGGLLTICLATPPQPTLPIGSQAIDTGGAMCAASETDVCLLAGADVTVTGTVTAFGKRPLVIVATHTMTITGTLDLSSRRVGSVVGAAADSVACNTPGPGVGDSHGSSGGAGGSFGGLGGSGGNGNTNFNSDGGQLRIGGTPGAIMSVTALRGGCKGADGGDASAGSGGTGGSSGGAVYLIAGTSIHVTGRVFASGAGGGIATGGEGGGAGAGTGGLIGFDAPVITIDGIVAANGGAGSGGSGTQIGGGGGDGTTDMFNTVAAGGGGSQGRGDGGTGTGGATATAGDGAASDGGGGGGGGGAGVIWVKGVVTGTQISPAPSLH